VSHLCTALSASTVLNSSTNCSTIVFCIQPERAPGSAPQVFIKFKRPAPPGAALPSDLQRSRVATGIDDRPAFKDLRALTTTAQQFQLMRIKEKAFVSYITLRFTIMDA
jgi:hypothetical protein